MYVFELQWFYHLDGFTAWLANRRGEEMSRQLSLR